MPVSCLSLLKGTLFVVQQASLALCFDPASGFDENTDYYEMSVDECVRDAENDCDWREVSRWEVPAGLESAEIPMPSRFGLFRVFPWACRTGPEGCIAGPLRKIRQIPQCDMLVDGTIGGPDFAVWRNQFLPEAVDLCVEYAMQKSICHGPEYYYRPKRGEECVR